MTVLEWVLSVTLIVVYVVAIFTVAVLTFRKGYLVLGVLGIIFPILWLVGAILPAKEGSGHWVDEETRWQAKFGETYYSKPPD
jgi:energy-coupling factor transporter transmembrane protein EcfT